MLEIYPCVPAVSSKSWDVIGLSRYIEFFTRLQCSAIDLPLLPILPFYNRVPCNPLSPILTNASHNLEGWDTNNIRRTEELFRTLVHARINLRVSYAPAHHQRYWICSAHTKMSIAGQLLWWENQPRAEAFEILVGTRRKAMYHNFGVHDIVEGYLSRLL